MSKIPVYLVTGFLGSGKTTLVQEVLTSYDQNKRIAVIQNEFAPHNFDGQELKRKTIREFDLLEVNNGSVFCVCLLSGFKESLMKFIQEYNPDMVLFEASGLSDPVSLGEIFNAPDIQELVYLAGTTCIVDASNFLRIHKLQQRLVHQVQIADKVIINKTDLVEDIQDVIKQLEKLNPFSQIIETSFCKTDISSLLAEVADQISFRKGEFQVSAEDLGRPDIKSVVYKTTKGIKKDLSRQFLEELAKKMIRIKGYLLLNSGESMAIQSAGEQIDMKLIERNIKQTELIAMGFHMNAGDVKQLYQQYCN